VGIRHAIVELGDVAVADEAAKSLEAAALFGHGNSEDGFAGFTDVCAFGDEAKAVEVHVRAAGDGNYGLVLPAVFCQIAFGAGNGESARGFEHAAGILEDVFDGGADGVGVDGDEVVDVLSGQPEGFFAHELDGRAV